MDTRLLKLRKKLKEIFSNPYGKNDFYTKAVKGY